MLNLIEFVEKIIGPDRCCGISKGGAVVFRDGALPPKFGPGTRCKTCGRHFQNTLWGSTQPQRAP